MAKPKSSGLEWKKLDLHVHTPGSADFVGGVKTAEAIVQAALAKGLDGIAITDHNSAAWVDRVVEAARNTRLAIFPGVEITVNGGESGVHVIALFDRTASGKTVEGLLAKVDILPKDQGKLECFSPKSVTEVIEIIDELGGLAVLAHADSSKGVLRDMKGQPRIGIMRHPKLAAAELCQWEKGQRFVDGTDPDYKRTLASYRASDNRDPSGGAGHAAEGIGSRFSWFKMDGVSLDSLRQCFHDAEIRIVADESSADRPEHMYPRIRSLSVSKGFFQGTQFGFHAGVNSVIGGKGVGKSLLVELLRFVLNQPSSIDAIRDDMFGKLREQVGVGGRVSAEVQLANGEVLEISRDFDDDENPYAIRPTGGDDIDASIERVFPVLAYSQTEAHEIARDRDAQLSLIDSLIDLSELQTDISDLRGKIRSTDAAIAAAALAEEDIDELQAKMKTLGVQIDQYDAALKSERHTELATLEPKTSFLAAALENAKDAGAIIAEASDGLAQLEVVGTGAALAKDAESKQVLALLETLRKEATHSLKGLDRKAATAEATIDRLTATWKKTVEAKRKEYNEWAQRQGGNRSELSAKRTRAKSELEKLSRQLKTENQKVDARKKSLLKREGFLDQLKAKEDELHSTRVAKFAAIEAGSNGRLKLELIPRGNRELFHQRLATLKIGSNLKDATITAIAESLSPRDLVRAVLQGDAKTVATRASLKDNQAERFVSVLRDSSDLLPLLRLEHELLCSDLPRVRYLKPDGAYHDLQSLSVGQKCTALLIIALSDDERPIIMDQPEDALDTPSVYDDVTVRLRSKKSDRQFILTTHNSTVAVASDTDMYHVLMASAAQGDLAVTGAMDRPVVMTQVIQHLEGGPKPFAIKSKKYTSSVSAG